MIEESLSELIDEFSVQEKLGRSEGSNGVKKLCRIANAIGYQDRQHFGQFHHNGSYGDLVEFLGDNPGAIEALFEWIADQDAEEWKENIESRLNEKEEGEADDFNE